MATKDVVAFHGERAIFGVRVHCTKCLTDCTHTDRSLSLTEQLPGTLIFQFNFDGLACECLEPDNDDWIVFEVEEL